MCTCACVLVPTAQAEYAAQAGLDANNADEVKASAELAVPVSESPCCRARVSETWLLNHFEWWATGR
jgi:hypothetical protein